MIKNISVVKDFLKEHSLETTIEEVVADVPICTICARRTNIIGIYEENETYRFYGLCSVHGPHVVSLENKIKLVLEKVSAQ